MLVQHDTSLAQGRRLHVAKDVVHILVRAALLLRNGKVQDDDEVAAGCEDVVCGVLSIGEGNRVKGDLDRLRRDLLDCIRELGKRDGVAVKNVSCPEGLHERLVVRGGGGDDGREAGELR